MHFNFIGSLIDGVPSYVCMYDVSLLTCSFVYFAMQVRDSKGGILAQKEKLVGQGKSTFTSEMPDSYEVCVISRIPPGNWGLFIVVF